MNRNLLIIGKPHSTKSTFLIQFYSKIVSNKTRLKLYKPIGNITAISEGRKKLSLGQEPSPTPPESSTVIEFPLLLDGEGIDLTCLDYGGEQINRIINNREVTKEWASALQVSSNWILFIRIGTLNNLGDLSNQTVAKGKDNDPTAPSIYSISDQTGFIELLQILLNSKGHDYHKKLSGLRLTVVLTCWDELSANHAPKSVLREHLPLLSTFIESNWDMSQVSVLGLSPQGMTLSNAKNQERFRAEGPENFGFIIKPDGKKSSDISELIALAL